MNDLFQYYHPNQKSLASSLGIDEFNRDYLLNMLAEETNEEFQVEIAKGDAHTCKNYDVVNNILQRVNKRVPDLDENYQIFILFHLMKGRDSILEALHVAIMLNSLAESLRHAMGDRPDSNPFEFSDN